ncbi:MAG: CaiB/BaiF CoA transferase family protein [Smithellaceae bacterium]
MVGALSGLVVLDFSRVVAGPVCTLLMADLGAEVIKVEMRNTGDSVRQIPPFTVGGEGHIYTGLNRGKKSITLDTTTAEGRKLALELIAKSDIIVENFAPGVMKQLGLDYESAIKVKPDIIFASVTGFGQTGPDASNPAFDIIAQASSGLMSLTGFPENPPTKCGPSIGDQSGGLFGLIGILAALHHRNKTGEGQYIDISMQDCLFLISALEFLPVYLNTNELPKRLGNQHQLLVPWDLYKTSDGHVIIGIVNNGQWQKLAELIGRADMVPTPESTTLVYRLQHKEETHNAVAEWVSRHTTAEVERILNPAGVAAASVKSMADLVADPHMKEREMLVEIDQTLSGKVKTFGSVFKMSKTPGNPYQSCDFLGEHNTEIYGEFLGYSDAQVREWMDKKVI